MNIIKIGFIFMAFGILANARPGIYKVTICPLGVGEFDKITEQIADALNPEVLTSNKISCKTVFDSQNKPTVALHPENGSEPPQNLLKKINKHFPNISAYYNKHKQHKQNS